MSLHSRTPAPEAWRLAQHRETTATGAADFTCRKQGSGTTFIEHALGGEQQQALTRACLRLPLTLSHACQPDGRVGATRCLVRREMDDEDDKGDEHEVQGACEGAGVRNLLAGWKINILSGHKKVEDTTAASVQPHVSGKCQMHYHASARQGLRQELHSDLFWSLESIQRRGQWFEVSDHKLLRERTKKKTNVYCSNKNIPLPCLVPESQSTLASRPLRWNPRDHPSKRPYASPRYCR